MQNVAFSESNLIASICRDSFYEFVKEFWGEVIAEKPVWNWHIRYLCYELQKLAERVFEGLPKKYDLVINISPGSTKSTIFSRMFPAWVWTRMPEAVTICGSFEKNLARDMGRNSKDIINSSKYKEAFPEIEIRRDLESNSHFGNTLKGERKSVGVGGNITGSHAHFIIIDDPLNPREAVSTLGLKNANDWMTETIPSRKKDLAIVPTILIMQRLHQDDPTQNMIARKGVKHICLPAELTPAVSPKKLRKRYVNGLMDTTRLPKKVLESQEEVLLAYGYACQYLQTPIARGGSLFNVERLEIDTPFKKNMKLVRYWDKAATKDAGAYTCGVLMGKDTDGTHWVLDVVRGQWLPDKRNDIMRQVAELDGGKTLIVTEQEPGSGGKESALYTVKQMAGFRVRLDRPDRDKTERAEPFADQLNHGNVRMKKAKWNKDFVEELRYFPNSKFKDQVDAASAAFMILNPARTKVGALAR